MYKISYWIRNYPQYLILPIFIGVLLLFISPDSYMFYPIGKCDSAMFFMGGKAMMNGMIPYVEFTDSKGLLLWLIYGIGYLISKTDYTGLFWLEWFMYTVCFIYIYRLAFLFLNNKSKSIFTCILMTIFIFNTWCRNEVRAEDWCLPFVLMSIYYSCKTIYFKKSLKTAFFVTGLSIGACFMIKYSISLMLSSVMIYLFFTSIRNKRNCIIMGSIALLGFVSIVIPLFLYLNTINAFTAFFNEYVINTFSTISTNGNPVIAYLHEIIMILSYPELCLLFTFSLWGCLSISKYCNKDRFFLVFVLLSFWAITTRHSLFYYFSICTFFPVFAIISILGNISYENKKKPLLISTIIFIYVLITNVYYSYYDPKYIRPDFRIVKSGYYKEQQKFDSILCKYKYPKIIYYNCLDRGDGISCEALPASKYWFRQIGATEEMNFSHLKAIKSRCADFIITEAFDSITMKRNSNILKNYGYKYCVDIEQYDRWGMRYRALFVNPITERKVNYKGTQYLSELNDIRNNTKKTNIATPKIFFFGMGNRKKYMFRDSTLINLNTKQVIRNYKGVDSINIIPDKYEVDIYSRFQISKIYEDENGIWIHENNYSTKLDKSDCRIYLPSFSNHKYASVLRVLHHEILFNIKESAVYPNIFVYKTPFYRDAFMAALCLEKTNNVHLLIPWIESVDNLYDMQNGEPEADNLGELLYLLSFTSDSPKKKQMVENITREVSRLTINKDGNVYIKGKTDGAYNALYPTLILKMALAKNKMKDLFSEKTESGEYDDLCWFGQKAPHRRNIKRWYKDFRFNYLDSPFPYLQWARAHYYDNVMMPFNTDDYPLSWECRGGSADFNSMMIVSKDAVERKICYPHVWTAAEMFLRLYEYKNK